MRFYKSILFKLFILLFLLLTFFVGIIVYIQVFFIQRAYAIPDYTVERLRQLEPYMDKLAMYKFNSNDNGYMDTMGKLEKSFNVNLILMDELLENTFSTSATEIVLDEYSINYIKKKIHEFDTSLHRYPEPGNRQPLFHIYNRYGLPTKYVALVKAFGQSDIDRTYAVAVFSEVFTSRSSGMLRDYTTYIFIVLMLVILGVSAALAYFVTNPILKINKTAVNIAALDFSKKCTVNNQNETGNLARTINTMSDNLQNALGALNAANSKLTKDLDLQKELDLMRRDFLAAAAHEFKTPISLIRGYSESITDGVAEGMEMEKALAIIVRETEKMDRFVNDILDLSRLESVGYELNFSELYINELLSEISNRYRNTVMDRGIIVVDAYSGCNIMVTGDKFRIEQVLTNFMSNAIDNTYIGGEITISVDINEGSALISIHNQGACILDSELDRIWEKFYRIEKSRNKKFGGTGLGLAISKTILNLHNIPFGVKNTSDGVVFYFTMKIAG